MEIATKRVKVLESGNQENSNKFGREPQRIFVFFPFASSPPLFTPFDLNRQLTRQTLQFQSPLSLCATRATTTPARAMLCTSVWLTRHLMLLPPPHLHHLLLLISSVQALMLPSRPRKVLSLVCIWSCCAIDAVVYNQDTSVAGSERCHRSPLRRRSCVFVVCFF